MNLFDSTNLFSIRLITSLIDLILARCYGGYIGAYNSLVGYLLLELRQLSMISKVRPSVAPTEFHPSSLSFDPKLPSSHS